MSIEKDSKKSELLTSKLEDNQNIRQSKDTKVWASAEASDSVFMPRDQEMINEIEGSEIGDTETCSKVDSIKSRKDSEEWKGGNDYGKEENNAMMTRVITLMYL